MFLKKKEFFLFIFLILLQSCSGGRIGNFLESSFNDLEKPTQSEDLQKNLIYKKNEIKENEEINNKNLEKPSQGEDLQKNLINKKNEVKENKEINKKNLEKIKKQEEKQINFLKDKKIKIQKN